MAGRLEQYEQLTAFLDGELSEAERAELERLLESDAEARGLLEELRETARRVGTVPRERAREGFGEAVRARLERESLLSEASARPMRWWKPMALAASLMIVSTVVYFGMARLQQERERRVFALVDGESRGRGFKGPRVQGVEGRSEEGVMRLAGAPAIPAEAVPGKADAPTAAPVFGVAEVEEDSAALATVADVKSEAKGAGEGGLMLKAVRPMAMASRSATSQPTTRPATSQPASQPATSQTSVEKPRG